MAAPSPTITADVTLTPPPNGGLGVPTERGTLTAQATREYVSGQPFLWLATAARPLPPWSDDIEADFGLGIYDDLKKYPYIASAIRFLILATFKNGLTIEPASTATDNAAENTQAETIADFVRRCVAALDDAFDAALRNMLDDALTYGTSTAEMVYELRKGGEDTGKLALVALKPKPRHAIRYVVDAYNNVIGMLAQLPNMPGGAYGFLIDIQNPPPNLLPADKFATLSFEPRHGDPRGHSILRPAYSAWWDVIQMRPEYRKHMARFGSPFIWGTPPENSASTYQTDPYGAVVIDPTTGMPIGNDPLGRLGGVLANMQNGAYAALAPGSQLHVEQQGGDGASFRLFEETRNRDMVQAILGAALATMEGQHQARASSQTHMDVVTMLIDYLKQLVCGTGRTDIFKPLVRYNYGAEAADKYTPTCNLGPTTQRDIAPLMSALSSLFATGYFSAAKTEQIAALDSDMGLPPRADADPNAAPVVPVQPTAPTTPPPPVPTPSDAQQPTALPETTLEKGKIDG